MIKYTQLEMGQQLWHEESTLTKLYQSSFTQSSRNTLYNCVQGGNSLKSQPRGQIKHLQQAPAQTAPWLFSFKLSRCLRAPKTFYWISNGVSQVLLCGTGIASFLLNASSSSSSSSSSNLQKRNPMITIKDRPSCGCRLRTKIRPMSSYLRLSFCYLSC